MAEEQLKEAVLAYTLLYMNIEVWNFASPSPLGILSHHTLYLAKYQPYC